MCDSSLESSQQAPGHRDRQPQEPEAPEGLLVTTLSRHDLLVCKMTCHKKCVHKIQTYCSYPCGRKVSPLRPGTFQNNSRFRTGCLWKAVLRGVEERVCLVQGQGKASDRSRELASGAGPEAKHSRFCLSTLRLRGRGWACVCISKPGPVPPFSGLRE